MQGTSVSGEADWGGQNQYSGSAERPKRAALPPPRGQRRLRLTRRGRRARLSGEGKPKTEIPACLQKNESLHCCLRRGEKGGPTKNFNFWGTRACVCFF